MGKYTRRAALGAIAGGIVLFISDTAGFSSIEGDRTADTQLSDDGSAIIKLTGAVFDTNSDRPTEPAEITITNNSEVPFDTTSEITITSQNKKFRFREKNTGSAAQTQLTQNDLIDATEQFNPGDSFNIEILTASDETGSVTDNLQAELRALSESLTADLSRQISLQFKATGQLVYASDQNTLKVLDTVQNNITNPAESSNIDSVGSIVADLTGDGNADIAYIRNKRLELTQISVDRDNNITTVFGPGKRKDKDEDEGEEEDEEEDEDENEDENGSNGNGNNTANSPVDPNTDGTRVAAGDLDSWPDERVDDSDSGRVKRKYSVSGSVALFADTGRNKIFAAQPSTATKDTAVEVLIDTSNIGGAAGVAGLEDIDNDGLAELVYLNSSQQLNFIKQIDTTKFTSPSEWVNTQSNYSKVLTKYKDSNNSSKFGKTVGENNNIAFGKATLGNASVGSNANVGVSAVGEFSAGDNKQIPFVDGSNELAVINHKNEKTNLTMNTSAIKKAAIAPVDIDDDGITELFFIGDPNKDALPDVDTEGVNLNNGGNSGPIFYVSNPAGIIDNGESADIELLQVPPDQYSRDEVIGDNKSDTPGYIVPDISIGLNAGTVI